MIAALILRTFLRYSGEEPAQVMPSVFDTFRSTLHRYVGSNLSLRPAGAYLLRQFYPSSSLMTSLASWCYSAWFYPFPATGSAGLRRRHPTPTTLCLTTQRAQPVSTTCFLLMTLSGRRRQVGAGLCNSSHQRR